MADPLALAIATAVAGKAAESLTGQAQQAIATLMGKVRERLRRHPEGTVTLDAAAADRSAAESLAVALEREFEASPDFRNELMSLWQQIGESSVDAAVSNVFVGTADRVVQLRDVHGDFTIN